MASGKLYSIFYSKCPRCNCGNLYEDSNAFHLSKLTHMHKTCSCCGQRYELETGFYYGAMYVSYGLSVALVVPLIGLLYWGLHLDVFSISLITLGVVVVMFPLIFRWSRNIWLNMFVAYDEEFRCEPPEKK